MEGFEMAATTTSKAVCVSGTGLYTPPESVSNDELVATFNQYVDLYNARNATKIAVGALPEKQHSSVEFIVKASGIHSRHVVDRQGILDPEEMRPRIPKRSDDEPSLMVEMGLVAAKEALERAGRSPADIDCVIMACSNFQRPYPAIAVELQHYLGCPGYAYDMNVACASAAFGLQAAVDAVARGSARAVLAVNVEICTGHLNFRDRDCHFIFGDAATAAVVEPLQSVRSQTVFEVLGTRLRTQFSSNIRNNFGFMNGSEEPPRSPDDRLFRQEGRKVFKDVVPFASELIVEHLQALGIDPATLKRLWLHQANLSMNQLIAKRVLGRDPEPEEAPVILDEYANTSSAGSVIAFHKHHQDLVKGDLGVLCGFGAGYSAGSVVMRRQ
jgi:beta-ketodecanoyl-[acyl-carrier-protein] synthase